MENEFSGMGYDSKKDRFSIIINMTKDDAERLKRIMDIAGIEFDFNEHAGFVEGIPAKGRLRFSPPAPLLASQKAAIVGLLDPSSP